MGAVPASSGAVLQAGRPPLPCHPLSGGVERGEPCAGGLETMQDSGESIGLLKQEHLGRVLALETCQKWDKCRSAISDPYSWLFPGSVHSPFPAVLGWR